MRVVVDEQRRFAQTADRVGEPVPVPFGDVAGLEPARFDMRLCREQPLRELDRSHLHREEQHGTARGHRGVRGRAERERGLARTGSRCDHDQVRRLQSEQETVELAITGGEPGQVAVVPVQGLELVERLLQRIGDPDHAVGHAVLGNLEDERLGAVERVDDVVGRLVAHLGDLARDADEPPQQRELVDDARVMPRVG